MKDVQYLASTKRRGMSKARAARIFLASGGICYLCGVQIKGGESYEIEHPDMLAAGGSDKDEDLFPVHVKCHKTKTAADMGDLAKRNRLVTAGWVGKSKGNPMPGSKRSPFKKRMDGSVVRRDLDD